MRPATRWGTTATKHLRWTTRFRRRRKSPPDGGSGAGNDYLATEENITLEGTFDGSDNVTVYVNGSTDGVVVNGNSWQYTGVLTSGSNLFTVTVVDAAGNTSTDTITVIFNVPAGGWTEDHVIPAGQVSQSTDGKGILTVRFKLRDPSQDSCTLHTFEYSTDGGSNWSAPNNGDNTEALSSGWADNSGTRYATTTAFNTGAEYFFTFDTGHADVSGFDAVDQNDVRLRFTVNDGVYDSPPADRDRRFPGGQAFTHRCKSVTVVIPILSGTKIR